MSNETAAPAPDHPEVPGSINRFKLLEMVLPCCEPASACLMYLKGDKPGPGWIHGNADVARAIAAYRSNTLSAETFNSTTQTGTPYVIQDATRFGGVLHRDGKVGAICVDLDNHGNDGGKVHLLPAINRFFGASAIVFTSRSGKGLHCFYLLAEPIPITEFLAWARAWGFNRRGDIELFPKTEKLTQVWLPNDANEAGGDTYKQGTPESCVIQALPAAPTKRLNKDSLDFCRGFVAQGYRNEAMNATAFSMGTKYVSEEEARRLCMRGAELCGLLAEEPEKTVASFSSGFQAGAAEVRGKQANPTDDSTASAESLRGYACTDFGNAQRLVKQHGASLRYCFEYGYWLVSTGTHWTISFPEAELRAKATVQRLYAEAAALDDPNDQKKLLAHARKSENANRIAAMMSLARSEPGIPVVPDQLDADPWLLNCSNGTIDLRTGILHPHRCEALITKIVMVVFDPAALCPRFLAFLTRITGGNVQLILFLQRAIGYALTGTTSERCIFIFFGTGKNGKSVLIECIRMVCGDGYAARTPTQTLMSKRGESIPNDVARLKGMRFVSASETGEGKALDEALIKDLTGGERISARFMRGEWFEFKPQFKIFLSTNHRPRVRGTDDAIWDRLKLVPFNERITEEEQRPMEELLAEFREELPGILAWGVRGCLDWQKEGLGSPDEIGAATIEYRAEMDTLGAFLTERCQLIAGIRTPGRTMFQAYKKWCAEVGDRDALDEREFSISMSERSDREGFSKTRTNKGVIWIGICLVSSDEQPPMQIARV